MKSKRRDFIKMAGFAGAGVVTAGVFDGYASTGSSKNNVVDLPEKIEEYQKSIATQRPKPPAQSSKESLDGTSFAGGKAKRFGAAYMAERRQALPRVYVVHEQIVDRPVQAGRHLFVGALDQFVPEQTPSLDQRFGQGRVQGGPD